MTRRATYKLAQWVRAAALAAGVLLAPALPVSIVHAQSAEQSAKTNQSSAAQLGAWKANDDDALFFDMRVKNWRLGNGVRGYQTDRGICLDMRDLMIALDIPIRVDPKSRRANGWFFSEERSFTLDLDQNSVQVGGKVERLSPGDLYVTPEGWCVDADVFSKWAGIRVKPDISNALIFVESDEPMPFEKAEERKEKAARIRPSSNFDLRSLPQAQTPYAMWRTPSVDVNVGAAITKRPGESLKNNQQYEIFASGEVVNHSFDARLSSNDKGTPDSLRMRLYRTDPDAGLLGPLKATHYEVGDVLMPSQRLVPQASAGRGAYLTNRPVYRSTEFDRQSFSGELPRGWDAELYRNDQLIGFTTGNGNGQYEFFEIPLLFGANHFQIRLYGPQGQEKTEDFNYTVGIDSIPPQETWYWAGASQAGHDLIGVGSSKVEDRRGWQAGFGLERGLDARTSVSGSYYLIELDNRKSHFAELAVRRSLGAMLAEIGVASDLGNDYAVRGQMAGKLGSNILSFDTVWYSRGFERVDTSDNLQSETQLGWDRTINFGPTAIPLNITATYATYSNKEQRYGVTARASANMAGIYVTGEVDWRKKVNNYAPASKFDEQLAGNLRLSGRVGGVRLRGQVTYEFCPNSVFREASLVADVPLGEASSLRLDANYNAQSHLGRFSVGYAHKFDAFTLSATGEVTSKGGYGLGLNMLFSLGPAPQGGIAMSSEKLASKGQAQVTVFYDENTDGIRQPNEKSESGVVLTAGMAMLEETGENGSALIKGLIPFKPILIGIDESSLANPYVVPAGPGIVVTPRPGIATKVEIALVATGEIDGTLMAPGGRPLTGVTLELVDPTGNVLKRTNTEFDGFFLFEKVPYGHYSLRLDRASAAAVDAEVELNVEARLGAQTPLVSFGALAVRMAKREQVADAGAP